jgi:hypothetical protein
VPTLECEFLIHNGTIPLSDLESLTPLLFLNKENKDKPLKQAKFIDDFASFSSKNEDLKEKIIFF